MTIRVTDSIYEKIRCLAIKIPSVTRAKWMLTEWGTWSTYKRLSEHKFYLLFFRNNCELYTKAKRTKRVNYLSYTRLISLGLLTCIHTLFLSPWKCIFTILFIYSYAFIIVHTFSCARAARRVRHENLLRVSWAVKFRPWPGLLAFKYRSRA